MEYLLSEHPRPYPQKTVTALGFFDGIHIGHRALLESAVRLAKQLGVTPAVFTFADIPAKPKQKLCRKDEWLALMRQIGIEVVFIADFDTLKNQSPAEFVNKTLQADCRAVAAVCGFNFHFGKGACANAETLSSLMPCTVVPPVCIEGQTVSSSLIRDTLSAGNVALAARLLGRPFALTAPVLHGKALGRQHGIPTANTQPPEFYPQNGVYITQAVTDGICCPALTDIGTRPTVEGKGAVRLETHIPDLDRDLYGKELTVVFQKRLRGEMKFADTDALFAQIARDLQALQAYTKERN